VISENPEPVYAGATHAPWREILRQRWSGRLDRVLVLKTRDGDYCALPSRHRRSSRRGSSEMPYEPGSVASEAATAPKALGRYDSAFLVQLDDRSGTQGVALPTPYGSESVDVQVLWWVHDPVQVVRTRTKNGWESVRKDLRRRLRLLEDQCVSAGHSFGAPEMMRHLSSPQELPDRGLVYQVTDVRSKEAEGELRLGQAADAAVPYSWSANRREEYDFCMQAVSNGPVSLAALWLHRHPDQVSQVLDWAVSHANLLRGETTWQDGMAGLLGSLSGQEQLELSELLRDRLIALGRRVPPQQDAPADRGAAHPQAQPGTHGWQDNTANGKRL